METVSPNQGSLEGENPRAALKLEIEGMHCAGCVSSVEKALNGLVGVETPKSTCPSNTERCCMIPIELNRD